MLGVNVQGEMWELSLPEKRDLGRGEGHIYYY
jgi:hypothetical protein